MVMVQFLGFFRLETDRAPADEVDLPVEFLLSGCGPSQAPPGSCSLSAAGLCIDAVTRSLAWGDRLETRKRHRTGSLAFSIWTCRRNQLTG